MDREDRVDASGVLTTGFLARRYGISLRTLRFYEEKGLLRPKRVGRVRLFSADDEVRLELVLTGKRLGFSLREIDVIIQSHFAKSEATPATLSGALDLETIKGQLLLLENQRADLEATIDELKALIREASPDDA